MKKLSQTFRIFIFDIRQRSRAMLIWTIVWALMNLMLFSFFDSMKESSADLTQVYQNMPAEFMEAFSFDAESIWTIPGFFNTEFLVLYLISCGILGAYWGVSSIGKELSNKSILFVLSKPVSRINIYLSKVLAILTLSVVSNALIYASAFVSVIFLTEGDVPYKFFLATFAGTVLFQTLFVAFGEFLGVIIKDGTALGASIVLIILSFFLDIFSKLNKDMEFLKYLTPYYYLNTDYIRENEALRTPRIYTLVLVLIVIFAAGAWVFKRKNVDI